MSLTVQPAFGSYDYEANDADVEEWRDEGAVRSALTPVPRSHVARAIDGFLGPRRISIRGIIGPDGGGTRDQLRTATDAFNYAHRQGYRQLYRDSDRYLYAEVRRVTVGDDEGLSFVPFAVELEAADPYWYSTSAAADAWNTPATGNTRGIDNQGSAPAAPVFTITVSATGNLTLTLTNSTTGESFTITALPVTNGQALVVDCAAQTVKLAGSNAMSYFTGSFWLLEPRGGLQAFTAATDDVVTAAAHGYSDGNAVVLTAPTTGSLPTGLSAATVYYVRDKTADTFKLAATPGGAAIDITAAGNGGSVQLANLLTLTLSGVTLTSIGTAFTPRYL